MLVGFIAQMPPLYLLQLQTILMSEISLLRTFVFLLSSDSSLFLLPISSCVYVNSDRSSLHYDGHFSIFTQPNTTELQQSL